MLFATWWSLVCPLVVLCMFQASVFAYFGEPILHGFDNRFDDMGEVRVEQFTIDNGSVILDIAVENTQNQGELWILDFQPYLFDNSKPPVTSTNGGQLIASHTGNCSNVFQDQPFDATNGFYQDEYLPAAPGGKELFNQFAAGADGFVPKSNGLVVRTETLSYRGNKDKFFDCVNTDGLSIWERHVYEESIEFNTTLYITNVRPKKSNDGESGISFIQSHVILYWRLLRTAIARFIISSTERIRPIFEYAVVRPVYIDDDETKGPDRNKAEVQLAFKTVTWSDTIMAVYEDASLTYNPINTDNALAFVKDDPQEVTVYYNPTDSTAKVIVDGVSVPICPADVNDITILATTICNEFGLALDSSTSISATASTSAIVGLSCTGSETNFGECSYTIGTDADCNSGALEVVCSPIDTAELPKSCHDFLQAAKREGVILEDGIYDIDVGNTRTSVYCDMTRDGGGWTLILTTAGQDGFTMANLLSNNPTVPSISSDYSILGVADSIVSTSDGNNFRYRIEAGAPGQDGGIWEAPLTTSLVGDTDTKATTLIEKFGLWEENLPDGGGPQNIMPFIVPTDNNLLTTGTPGNFGAIVCSCTGSSYNPAPWIDGVVDQPETIWYWVKEDKTDPTANTVHASTYEEAMLAPECDFTEYPGECTQHWRYTVILDVDDTGLDADKPIDATGEFVVGYYMYQCPNLVSGQKDDCLELDVPIAYIGTEVTLQTTVQITDATKDKPIVLLKRLYGRDPAIDLRDGARGIQHLEQITIQTHFFPEFVREHLEMKLTLFMVCLGNYKDDPDGCLVAPDADAYIAHVSPDFYYQTLVDHSDESLGYKEYFADDVSHLVTRTLDENIYIHNKDIHQSKFTNRALSDVARLCTITNVFVLIDRNEPADRKKRDFVLVSHDMVRRDIEDAVALPQTNSMLLESTGCPENSIHDRENLHCICIKEDKEYSPETFKCEPVSVLSEKEREDDSSAILISTSYYVILACLLILFV